MRAIVTGVGVVGLALVLAGCDLGQRPVRVNRVPGMDVAAGDVDGDGDGDPGVGRVVHDDELGGHRGP
jgi:hypothetical protein